MTAFLLFTNLGGTPLRVNAEERCAAVVEAMVETNDYAVPRLRGEIRLNKPPLFYWAAALVSELAGGFSLTTLRMPSALSGLALIGFVVLWGRLLGSPPAGIAAGAMLAVSYLFVQQGRQGSYEMMLAFFSQASLFALACLVARPGWSRGLTAAACFTGALMTKGTPAFATVLLPAVVWIITMGRKKWLADVRVIATFLVSLVAGFGWYAWLLLRRPDVRDEVVAIALLPFGVDSKNAGAEHYEGPHFFLVKIWEEAFPVSLLLPLAVLYLWRNRLFPASSPWRLVALSFLVPLLAFSIIPQKQDHYLLPMLAPLALLCARAALWGLGELQGRFRLLLQVPAWLVAAVLVASGIAGVIGFTLIADWPRPAAGAVGALIAGAGICTGMAVIRHHWTRGFLSGLAGLALVWIGYFAILNPVIDNFGSGRIYFDPRYDPRPWEEKFRRYPVLVKILDVKTGLRHVKQVEKELESGKVDLTPTPAPRLP